MAIPDNWNSVAIPYIIQQRCLHRWKVQSAVSATAGFLV